MMDTKVLIKVGGVSRLPWIDWAKAMCMCNTYTYTLL